MHSDTSLRVNWPYIVFVVLVGIAARQFQNMLETIYLLGRMGKPEVINGVAA